MVDSSRLCARLHCNDTLRNSSDPVVRDYAYRMFDASCPRKRKIFFGDVVEMERADAERIFGKMDEESYLSRNWMA